MSVVLPLTSTEPRYEVFTILDEVTYGLNVYWVDRESAWYMDLLTEEGVVIASGLKLMIGAAVGNQYRYLPTWPNGVFVVTDLSNQDRDATLTDLGTRVVVYYHPNE